MTQKHHRSIFNLAASLLLLVPVACAPVVEYSPTQLSPAAAGKPTGSVTFAVVNGTLIDGSGAPPIQDAVVLIQGELILAVGPRSSIEIPPGVETLDADGGTILPGFINAHVHEAFYEQNLEQWVLGGVTTVRDEGMRSSRPITETLALRTKTSLNPKYARLISAGLMMTAPGGYGSLYVTSPEEAREKVFAQLDAGVEMIKLSLEDGYAGESGLPKLTSEQIAAIIEAAHSRGARVSGHITQSRYMAALVDAGVDDIAHIPYDPAPLDLLQRMAEGGIPVTPTFTIFRNFNAPVENCVENLRQFVRLGGIVALGNDYGGGPGDFELGIPMYEIEKMAEAGMTPMQIILASTKNAALVSGLEGQVGVLKPGLLADLIIVSGDPLQDLSALNKLKVVVHSGVVIRR